jgi:hypothetical protein
MFAMQIHRWRRRNPDKSGLASVLTAVSAGCCLISGLVLAL